VAHRGTKILRTYRIQPLDGTLVASGSTETVWGEPSSMVVHPSGRLLYVILRDTGEAVSFRIDAIDGSISSPIVQSAGLVPASISVDLRGRFAYTANSNPQGVGDLTHYQIDPITGNLTFAESVATQLLPVSVQVGPSGRFLYVVNQGTDVITVYGLDPMSGDLTLVGLPIPTGAMPTGIALIGWLE
jgi:6-phosphogluconolactonase (cycloisomerase 2 family)